MRTTGLIVLFLLTSLAARSQECPPINFAGTTLARVYFRSSPREIGGLLRAGDGSHTRYRFQTFTPWTKRGEDTNFDATLGRCSGFTPTMGTAAPPLALANPMIGAAGNTPLVLDLRKDGTFAAIFVSALISRNNLIVDQTSAGKTHLERKTYATGANPMSLVLGDFNKDSRVDAAVLYGGSDFATQSGVSIFLGQDNGQFGAANNIGLGVSPTMAGVTTADFDGDGNLDLAFANTTAVTLKVLRGNGDGTFQPATEQASLAFVSALIAADINKDGRADLVVAGSTNNAPRLAVLLAQAGGGFQKQPEQPVPQAVAGMVAGDFNGDGNVDLATSNRFSGSIHVLSGSGTGAFSYLRSYQGAYGQTSLMTADYDLDGKLDIVAAAGHPEAITRGDLNEEAAIFFGRGDGSFRGGSAIPIPGFPHAAVSGDFNRDQRMDVAIASGFGSTLTVLLRTADGGFGTSSVPLALEQFDNSSANGLAAGDFDKDGAVDLVVPKSNQSRAAYLRGRGDGGFQPATSLAICTNAADAVAADVNGDGNLDLVVGCPGQGNPSQRGVGVLLGAGNGSFQPIAITQTPQAPKALVSADVTGDGKLDAVVGWGVQDNQGNHSGGVYVLAGNGNGTFQALREFSPGLSVGRMTVSDINGDNVADVLMTGASGSFGFRIGLLVSGAGGALSASSFATDFGPGSMAVADFNGDGKRDLIVAHCCGETDLTFHLGTGSRVFQPEVHFGAGASPGIVLPFDVDGTGGIDLLVATNDTTADAALVPLVNASPAPVPLLTSVSAASFEGERVAPESLVSGFGGELAAGSASAQAVPLPTSLAGSSLEIVDSAGTKHTPGLLFISPSQVNYLMPRNMANGLATATVTAANGAKSRGYLNVQSVAPALFTFNAEGLVAGAVVRVKPGGTQTEEPIFQQPQPGQIVARPIDLGPDGDQVFLVMYGTGIRRRFNLDLVSVTIGGETIKPEYAGPQGQFEGLDQVNVKLPRSLAGKGSVEIRLRVDGGVDAAPVRVTIQ